MNSPHEPSALLLTAEDAIQDAENLQQWFRQPETNKSSIPVVVRHMVHKKKAKNTLPTPIAVNPPRPDLRGFGNLGGLG